MPDNHISHLKILYYRKFKDGIERNSFAGTGGWIIGGGGGGGGGAKGMLAPPLPTPMHVLQYVKLTVSPSS